MKISQRDICIANLNPAKGSEQAGKRPVVVISGNTMNDSLPICIVCPISTRVKNYPSCVKVIPSAVNKLTHTSEILTFQIRAISQNRIVKKIGRINNKEFAQVVVGLHDIIVY